MGEGKELSDLLVIFDNRIFIFSDKDRAFPENNNGIKVNWARRYKKAIQNSVDQVFGDGSK